MLCVKWKAKRKMKHKVAFFYFFSFSRFISIILLRRNHALGHGREGKLYRERFFLLLFVFQVIVLPVTGQDSEVDSSQRIGNGSGGWHHVATR